jgi:hypothetical protein
MTTRTSLETRLKNIPEPDLARQRGEKIYRFLKQFPYERRCALRELIREAVKAGRSLSKEEVAAALGIDIQTRDDSPAAEQRKAFADPGTDEDPKARRTTPDRKGGTQSVAPKRRTSIGPEKPVQAPMSRKPPLPSAKSSQPKSTSKPGTDHA